MVSATKIGSLPDRVLVPRASLSSPSFSTRGLYSSFKII